MARILLVESARPKASCASALERRNYEVVRVTTSRAAIAQAKETPPALIILDSTAPRVDGGRTCRDIRAQLDGVAILLLVRSNVQVDPACGADFVLAQPFTSRKLLNRVARMLPSGKALVLTAGDLTLNVANRCVRLGRQEHQLTPKQSQLLEIFMRRPNSVITRLELMKAVWDTDYMGDTRTLDVHIRWLRQIIESDAGKPHRLVTVRSVGYKLEV
jgi:DNA-binding response OmpR family regulator